MEFEKIQVFCTLRELVNCNWCGKEMYIYTFSDGEIKGTHKHENVVHIPRPYTPIKTIN